MRFGKEMENFGIHSQAQQEEIFEQMQKGMMGTPGYDNPFGMNVNYDMEQAMNSKQVEDARDAIGLLMSGETQSLSNDGEYEAAANRAAAITDKERDAIQYQIDRQEEVGKEGENWGGWKAWKVRQGGCAKKKGKVILPVMCMTMTRMITTNMHMVTRTMMTIRTATPMMALTLMPGSTLQTPVPGWP